VKSATLVSTLTSLTTAMAVAAPVVVFGFLYALQVHPERAAAAEARRQLADARTEMDRQRVFVSPQAVVTEVTALDEFNARTVEGDGVGEVADALTAVLDSPTVGGVSNVSIETGTSEDVPVGATARLFEQTIKQAPVTLTFDARFEQIGRFFWNLRVLPSTFNLQSVELTPAGASVGGLMRARLSLLVFHHPDVSPREVRATRVVDVIASPRWTRDPFANAAAASRSAAPTEPDAVVTSILFSPVRRVAIVDGRIVRAGDRVRAGIVREIEADAVVIVGAGGKERRLAIARPALWMAKR
jgi:hypothetical protein